METAHPVSGRHAGLRISERAAHLVKKKRKTKRRFAERGWGIVQEHLDLIKTRCGAELSLLEELKQRRQMRETSEDKNQPIYLSLCLNVSSRPPRARRPLPKRWILPKQICAPRGERSN